MHCEVRIENYRVLKFGILQEVSKAPPLKVQRAVCLWIKKKRLTWSLKMRNVGKAHILMCQNPKSGSNKTVVSFVVFGRRFCWYTTCFYSRGFGIFLVRCSDWNVTFVRRWLRSAAVWNVTPCSLLETYRLPEELAASSSWPPPWETGVLHVEKASEPTCFVSLFYAEGGGLHVSSRRQ